MSILLDFFRNPTETLATQANKNSGFGYFGNSTCPITIIIIIIIKIIIIIIIIIIVIKLIYETVKTNDKIRRFGVVMTLLSRNNVFDHANYSI